MVNAFIMIKTGTGESEPLVGALSNLDHVTEAHVVAGSYDVIAEVEADEVYDILKTASTDIQKLGGVSTTKTYISLDD